MIDGRVRDLVEVARRSRPSSWRGLDLDGREVGGHVGLVRRERLARDDVVAARASVPRSCRRSRCRGPRRVRSTTMPAWTSASSSSDRASLSVVRRFEERRHRRRPWSGVERAARRDASSAIQPIGRSCRRRRAAGSANGSAAARRARGRGVVADAGRGRRARRSRSPTRLSDSRLRPRSAPTNRATNSDRPARRGSRPAARTGRDAADLHDRDEVAHLDRLVDVVGHEQDRLGELLLEAQELVLEALADDRDRPRRTARP